MGAGYFCQFDAFAKPLKDFRIKTISGALVTICSAFLITLLFFSELRTYVHPQNKEEIVVDVNFDKKIVITLNITYFNIPCSVLNIDTLDSTGEQAHIQHEVYKTSVDLEGSPISSTVLHEINSVATVEPLLHNETDSCGSCYGAESDTVKCCKSCDDVLVAYRDRGWFVGNASIFRQCRMENWSEAFKQLNKEGCRIHGTIRVSKVDGSFHISPGRIHRGPYLHYHETDTTIDKMLNLSHKINSLIFGDTFPGQVNALDNYEMILHEYSKKFTYFLKLVPTIYHQYDSQANQYRPLQTNQYSATWHSLGKTDSPPEKDSLGLFFMYEISPLLVKISPVKQSFLHFLTNTCAIVGGVFTVASLFDAFIYQSTCVFRRRITGRD